MELRDCIKKIIYLGPEGTYSDMAKDVAIQKYHLQNIQSEPFPSIKSIIDYTDENEGICAIVPIENSIEGVVRETIDNLTVAKNEELKIVEEFVIPVNNCLLARNKVSREDIKSIISYTQPLAQCRNYLVKNFSEARIIETSSTAAAAKKLLELDEHFAAIANLKAAELYNLNIIEENINDRDDNKTRFVVIAKYQANDISNAKTSIVFSTCNTAGALCDILTIFKKYNINLSYIDSRPSGKNLKEYNFYIDFEGHINDSIVKKAINEMCEYTTFFRHNGSYGMYK